MTTLDTIPFIPPTNDKETASTLSKVYWEIHNQRIEFLNLSSNNETLNYFQNLIIELESQIDHSLMSFCKNNFTAQWATSQVGVGPVTASRLLNYINISKSRTPEHLWSYAGLVPNNSSKSKSTYNNHLKEVCVDLGKNFVKYSFKKDCFYGNLYLEDRERRNNLNSQKEYADLAKEALANPNTKDKNWLKDKQIYELDMLPQERIDAQAQRYAVKIFLAHWHAVAYYEAFGIIYESHHKNIVPINNSPF